ncbi:hypothetical protein OsJ_27887 [Oryza sativa Japonica Group]|uniref:SBP-type domain-containing protein n=1 Tax=Oryza sativa subsp. japonica TaxID=39947 RepID=B9G1Q9_ORYSJ|nr:hypothetical protein OsJ_27887 [Oryza sativa Japonica Group]
MASGGGAAAAAGGELGGSGGFLFLRGRAPPAARSQVRQEDLLRGRRRGSRRRRHWQWQWQRERRAAVLVFQGGGWWTRRRGQEQGEGRGRGGATAAAAAAAVPGGGVFKVYEHGHHIRCTVKWFHLLPEFDQGKRSCRRRLAGHNERRRRPQTPLASRYGRLAASVGEEHRRFRSFTLDFSYPRVPSSVRNAWPAIQPGDRISGGIQWHRNVAPHGHSSAVAGYGANTYSGQGSSSSGPPVFAGPNLPPGGCLAGVGAATDSSCALSLLSTQPWDTTTHSAAASHNQAAAMSTTTSFDGNPVAPSAMAGSYMAPSPWTGSRGHEGGGRSVAHQLPHEVSLDEVHPGPSHHAHFSGELELALQGNGPAPAPRIDPGSGSTFDQTSNTMDWSL